MGRSMSQGQTPWGLQHGENFREWQAEVVSHRHGGNSEDGRWEHLGISTEIQGVRLQTG